MQSRTFQPEPSSRLNSGATESPSSERKSDEPAVRETSEKRRPSILGADVIITGNIEASGDLHIEGMVIGEVHGVTVTLGKGCSVNGGIYAARVKVSGTVEGSIETRDLAVETGARLVANITYGRLRIANGGLVKGNLKWRISEQKAV